MTHLDTLEATFRRINDLDHAIAMLEWDESVMMPAAGGDDRGRALATLYGMRHAQLTDGALGDHFAQAEADATTADARASLHEMQRSWQRATSLPRSLVEAQKAAESKSEQAWRTLRKANDWASYQPLLEDVVKLKREVATAWGQAFGQAPYDALMDTYESGLTRPLVDQLFGELRAALPGLTQRIVEAQRKVPPTALPGPFPIAAQRSLGRRLMELVGFDMDGGRLDESAHPFCGGVPSDVRITTRYDESDFQSAMMGVLHEAGHAKYEQGLPKAWRGLPVGLARGMALHESQSLLQEMQVCRSRAFVELATPYIQDAFGARPEFSTDNLYRHAIAVEPGFIRVDADEVTYPAHIILRYELERDLIEGRIQVADLPELWDLRMQELLGLSTRGNDRNGCMQDVHWPAGLFGYFPSYTLGALIAAQLFAAMRAQIPNIDGLIRTGEFAPLNTWLRTHVWNRASLVSREQLLLDATGQPLGTSAFLSHLEARYLGAA